MGEAYYHKQADNHLPRHIKKLIEESNNQFSRILAEVIEAPIAEAYRHVKDEYGKIAERNHIAQYNVDRLYYR